MSLPRTTVTVGPRDYYFDIIKTDKHTYSVQVAGQNSEIIADLPLDPMDNTLASVISESSIAKLGNHAGAVLEALSQFLQEKIGAKEFVLVPQGTALPNYVPVQDAPFKRLRHANRVDLEKSSATVLEQYKELTQELDNNYETVMGIKALEKKLSHGKPYEEIYALLNSHANFTPGKMDEYKEEDIEGVRARFNNGKVNTIAIVDKQHRLCGLMRSLSMGNKFAYLSDEVVNQKILPLEKFQGNTDEEREKNRSKFFIAYLTNKHCSLETDQDHFLLIAPDGRVDIYEEVGLQKFPIENNQYVATMKLAAPAPSLKTIKEEMCKPSFSQAAAMSNIGIMPSPNQDIVAGQQAQLQMTTTVRLNKQ